MRTRGATVFRIDRKGDIENEATREQLATTLLGDGSPPVAPSLRAQLPQQTQPSPEVARRMYQRIKNAIGQEPRWPHPDLVVDAEPVFAHESYTEEFIPDSMVSAADYLAPDDAGFARPAPPPRPSAVSKVPAK